MPELPRTMIKLAAAFVEHQAKKNLGEEAMSLLGNVLADYAGEKTLDKLVEFVQQGDRAEKLVEAFKEADQCFAETCGDPMLKQAIAMFPLAEIASLEKLAPLVRNLLSNALRHTPGGGKVTVSATAEKKMIRVVVADTGDGIPADELPRVFDRFYRGDKSRARASGGSGLGLAIAKTWVEAMGGEIGVESEPGRWSRFWFTVPAVR